MTFSRWDLKTEIAIIWSIADVRVSHSGSDAQCMQVLKAVEKNHDAERGVTWADVRCAADELGLKRVPEWGEVKED